MPTVNLAEFGTISIPDNDLQNSPFTYAIETFNGTPTLAITSGTAGWPTIVDGSVTTERANGTSLGFDQLESAPISETFRLANSGEDNENSVLSLGNVTISGPNAADFSVVTQPAAILHQNNTTTFTIQFQPSVPGTRTAQISFVENDPNDPGQFTFVISAVATQVPTSVSLTASAKSPAPGQAISVTATVASQSTGNPAPSQGTVTFWDGTTNLGSAPVAAGVAVLNNVAWTSPGNHTITATYDDGQNLYAAGSTVAANSSIVTTVAGNSKYSGDGGPATSAEVAQPAGLVVDAAGNVYFADTQHNAVREVLAGSDTIVTIAGTGAPGFGGDGGPATSALLHEPTGLALDPFGHLLISDSENRRVRAVNLATGIITTVAGGPNSLEGDGGLATAARLAYPQGIAVDNAGNLYIADTIDNLIREVTHSTGIITTIAGTGSFAFSGDGGLATQATMFSPTGVAVDSAGNVYFTDSNNNRVREVAAGTGIIQTVAGNGSLSFNGGGSLALSTGFGDPTGLQFDASGNLLVSDTADQHVLRIDHQTNLVSVVAGGGQGAPLGDGGSATAAGLFDPDAIALDSSGNLFIADEIHNRVREVSVSTNVINTIAGNGNFSVAGDGGPAAAAELAQASDVVTNSAGDVFIADSGNNLIREIAHATGLITTLANMWSPQGLAIDAFGNLYVSTYSQVFEINLSSGVSTLIAGTGQFGYGGDGGPAIAAEFDYAGDVAVDADGNVFVADGSNDVVREIDQATGIIHTIAGIAGQIGYTGDGGLATAAKINAPAGIAVDSADNVYIADPGDGVVREVNAATGIISTFAGSGVATTDSGDGGPATDAKLGWPSRLAVDPAGNVFIADNLGRTIREVNHATQSIYTIAGLGSGALGNNGPALAATLSAPLGLSLDAAGDLFVSDAGASQIRKIQGGEVVVSVFAQTGTALTSSAETSTFGQSITLTATVSANSAPAPSTGTVTFEDGGAVIGTAAVVSGVATMTTSALAPGAHVLTASYSGDNANYDPSSNSDLISTIAGTGYTNYNGDGIAATSALLYSPSSVVSDGLGHLYIADADNNRIREVNLSTGIITTVVGTGAGGYNGDGMQATAAELSDPSAVALDGLGNLYIGDTGNNRIREVNLATGIITTVAGSGTQGYNADNIPATSANLNRPRGIALDGHGNLFIDDQYNSRIREVTLSTGIITTVAGSGTAGYNGDSIQASAAELNDPSGIALDNFGHLLIADTYNNRIREVTLSSGVITTIAGNGILGYNGDNIQATAAELSRSFRRDRSRQFSEICSLPTTDNNRIREVTLSSGVITTIAGTGIHGYNGDGIQATSAELFSPQALALDGNGDLLFADEFNGRIRQVNLTSDIITTVAGTSDIGDGGPAVNAQLEPEGVAVDSAGNVYIADAAHGLVRMVDPATGVITTVAGTTNGGSQADGIQATDAKLDSPEGLLLDGNGHLFIADSFESTVREVTLATGIITTVAGVPGISGYNSDGIPATTAWLNDPQSMALDNSGHLFIADTWNSRVREVTLATGIITTVAGTGTAGYNGDNIQAAAANLSFPNEIAVDNNGHLFIADTLDFRIREVDLASGAITTVAGNGQYAYNGDGIQATAAGIGLSQDVVYDGNGHLLIGDFGNGLVRELTLSTGIITTSAGNLGSTYTGDGIPAIDAPVFPWNMTLDGNGNLFIADANLDRVREISPGVDINVSPAPPTISLTPAGGLYTVDGAPIPVVSSASVTDTNPSTNLSAAVSISGGFQPGDELNFASQNGIAGSYDSGTGVLTLTGGGTGASAIANYQAALASITFSSTSTSTVARTVSFTVSDGTSASAAATEQVAVLPFGVTSFTPNSTGFVIGLNVAPNLSVLNLYSGFNGALGAPDMTVLNGSTPVQGSLVWDPSTNTATFVQTRGILAPGTYNVTLVSGSDGWVDTHGNLLGAGSNYTATFTVATPTAPMLTLPDFARGPGQNVDVSDASSSYGTAATSLLPVALSDTTGVTSVSFELDYNASYLTVSSVQLAAGISGTLSVTNTTPGTLLVSITGFSSTAPAGAVGGTDIVDISASVPATAISSYGASALLKLVNPQVNAAAIAVADAVEKVAYFGDTTGDGTLSGLDASDDARNQVQLDNGFSAYPLTDPRIVGDVTGDGTISGQDASFIAQKSVQLSVPKIPDIPSHASLVKAATDPTITVPLGVAVSAGQSVTVPIGISDNAGGLLSASLTITYNPALLTFVSVKQSSELLDNYDWSLASNLIAPGTLRVSLFSNDASLGSGPAQLLNLKFAAPSNDLSGTSPIRVSGSLNEGGLSLSVNDGSVVVAGSMPNAPPTVLARDASITRAGNPLLAPTLADGGTSPGRVTETTLDGSLVMAVSLSSSARPTLVVSNALSNLAILEPQIGLKSGPTVASGSLNQAAVDSLLTLNGRRRSDPAAQSKAVDAVLAEPALDWWA